MKLCPACGEQNADTAKFCAECGAPLAPAAADRRERRVVSVLFADLVGSTSRSERLDVEDVEALLSRYHRLLRRELERHGGRLETTRAVRFCSPGTATRSPPWEISMASSRWRRPRRSWQARATLRPRSCYHNLAEGLVVVGDLRRAGQARGQAAGWAERFGKADQIGGVRSAQADTAYHLGELALMPGQDDAIRGAAALLPEASRWREALTEAELALSFYRQTGATRYAHRVEALLRASA